jgi:acyl carrier protein
MIDAKGGDPGGRSEAQIRDLVVAIVGELAGNKSVEVVEDRLLVEELEFHSLALLELAFTLEDEFDLLPITEEAARALTTVGKVIEHVLSQLRERAEQKPT